MGIPIQVYPYPVWVCPYPYPVWVYPCVRVRARARARARARVGIELERIEAGFEDRRNSGFPDFRKPRGILDFPRIR